MKKPKIQYILNLKVHIKNKNDYINIRNFYIIIKIKNNFYKNLQLSLIKGRKC